MKKLLLISIVLIIAIIIVFSQIIEKSKKSLLSVDSIPHAEISINGKIMGTTPTELELAPGTYSLELAVYQENSERVVYQTQVALEPQVKTVIKRKLNQNSALESGELLTLRSSLSTSGSVTVVTTPINAEVLIDTQRYTSPVTVSPLASGNHILRVSTPGFETYESIFQAINGFDVTAFIDLARSEPISKPEAVINTQKQVEIKPTPVGFLRVRQEPNSVSREVAQVKPGDRYTLVDESNTNYLKIMVNGVEGWISRTYATIL